MTAAVPADLRIRPAAAADGAALAEQFWLLNRHEAPITGNRRTDRRGGEESYIAALERVRQTGGVALVAELDGRIVAHLFLSIEQHSVYVPEDKRTYAYVLELFVREAQRRRGIGRALLAEAERFAAGRGLSEIMIGVLAGNTGAERAYAGYGFRPYALQLTKVISQ